MAPLPHAKPPDAIARANLPPLLPRIPSGPSVAVQVRFRSAPFDSRQVLEGPPRMQHPFHQTLKKLFYLMEFNPTLLCNDFDHVFLIQSFLAYFPWSLFANPAVVLHVDYWSSHSFIQSSKIDSLFPTLRLKLFFYYWSWY